MTPKTVEQWLTDLIGLDAQSLGPRAVAEAVRKRMAVCGLTVERDYLERLLVTPDESAALIEMIVVPETWFFRDREPFVFLERYVGATWPAAHPLQQLRVLSVPCSSGEEPYSIAMTLLAAGLAADRYRIDAVDISPVQLRNAVKGAYGPNSFRGGLPARCERYFTIEGAARIVVPDVRAGIRFIPGNIMNLREMFAGQTYDVVFCRNLFIYQQAGARGKILDALDQLLKPDGLLFVGHAEMISLITDRYAPVPHGGAFAYSKLNLRRTAAPQLPEMPDATSVASSVAAGFKQNARRQGWSGTSALPRRPVEFDVKAPLQSERIRKTSSSPLDDIRVLADQGRLAEAAAMCQNLLKDHPQLAEAHFILGLIRAATGNMAEAEECLSRALYLDADFYEALTHLALLKARGGDEAGAERLRRRAERVREKSGVMA